MAQKKWSMRYWCKQKISAWDWQSAYWQAVSEFAANGEHSQIEWESEDYQDAPQVFAHELYVEINRRGKVYGDAYWTPPYVAMGMANLACAGSEDRVLDPCAGIGNLLWACKELGAKAVGFEISEDWVRVAEALRHDVRRCDALDGPWDVPTYDQATCVIMNPPYSKVPGRKGDGCTNFLAKIAEQVPGRRVVALLPNGWWERKAGKLAERFTLDYQEDLPADTFAPLTNIAASICVLEPVEAMEPVECEVVRTESEKVIVAEPAQAGRAATQLSLFGEAR